MVEDSQVSMADVGVKSHSWSKIVFCVNTSAAGELVKQGAKEETKA